MTAPERWEPDPMLVDSAVDGRLHAVGMDEADRCAVVAALSDRGESADQIADRLHCSPRLVKRIRADPLTVTLRRAAAAEHALAAAESHAERCDQLRRQETDLAVADVARCRRQLDDLVEQLRRTRAALDAERARRYQRAELLVYRRRPTPRQLADTTDPLFDIDERSAP